MSDIGMGLKLHVLIFLSQFLCSFGLHKLQFLDFYKRSNVRGREEYVSQSHYSRDSWSCISLCINTQDCITASFNQGKMCFEWKPLYHMFFIIEDKWVAC